MNIERKLFEDAAFRFKVLFEEDMRRIQEKLQKIMDVEKLLTDAKRMSDSKEYMVYKLQEATNTNADIPELA